MSNEKSLEEQYNNAFEYFLFIEKVEKAKEEYPKFRFGQVYFNLLMKVNEKVARKIYRTELDPYHYENVKPETHRFVLENWG